ncbi:MAG: DUF305 domain-containing protein [Ornithinimicrobium sp.]
MDSVREILLAARDHGHRTRLSGKRGPGGRVAAASVVLAVTLAGCGDTGGAPSDPAAQQAEHNRVDVMFAQMMIPHHDDAIAMAEYLEHVDGVDPRVDKLAAGIINAQVAENTAMNTWLTERGYSEVPSDPGQVNEQAIAGSTAAEIEDSFLTEMIAHHEHGIDMARSAADEGESPMMADLAQGMVDDQGQEVELMRDLLNEN